MKFLLVISFFLLCLGLSKQYPLFEDCTEKHPVFADKNVYLGLINRCVHVKCKADGSFSEKTCLEVSCQPGKKLDEKDVEKIYTQVFPACCGGPICAS